MTEMQFTFFLSQLIAWTGIIFGCRMTPQVKKEMIEYLDNEPSYSHVKQFDAVLDEREFKVNMVPTEQGGMN